MPFHSLQKKELAQAKLDIKHHSQDLDKILEYYSTFTHLDSQIAKSRSWIYSNYVETEHDAGWPHYSGSDKVTEWGGSVDVIRALSAISGTEVLYDSRVRDALHWLSKRQNSDGGWRTWGLEQSSLEITCWVLAIFKDIATEEFDVHAERAKQFIESCRHQDGSFASFPNATPRVYPTLLAAKLLRLTKSSLAGATLDWLRAAKNKDGGWGFRATDQKSNPAMTAQILIELCETDKIVDEDLRGEAIAWLLRNQRPGSEWENACEEWLPPNEYRGSRYSPIRIYHFSDPWAIVALLQVGLPASEATLMSAIHALCRKQLPDGSWEYNRYEENHRLWCTASALYALATVRQKLDLLTTLLRAIAEQLEGNAWSLQPRLRRQQSYICLLAVWITVLSVVEVWQVDTLQTIAKQVGINIFDWSRANINGIILGIATSVVASWIFLRLQSRKRSVPGENNH